MALRNIVMDGDEILKKTCRPVTSFDDRLATLLDDMHETMLDGDGLGLAAPQVGVMRRLFVAVEDSSLPQPKMDEEPGRLAEGEEPVQPEEEIKPVLLEFINPEIVEHEGEQRGYEGCLSFPGRFAAITRPMKVKVKAQDRDGQAFEYEAEGLMARCMCHEIDHLNGVTLEDLAEYFYDPEVPHDLDESIGAGRRDEDENAE